MNISKGCPLRVQYATANYLNYDKNTNNDKNLYFVKLESNQNQYQLISYRGLTNGY